MDSTAENDYFELEPYDQYKAQDSKFLASLKWLLNKAYSNSIPLNLSEPFFEENELGKSLRSELVQELIRGRVYCLACKHIFANSKPNNGFTTIQDVFEQLAKNSIQVSDENDDPVTCQIIQQDSPFYVSAHLALIDSLMLAYSLRIMRLENVINSIKRFSKFNTSNEMPSSLEATCSLWLNKITKTVLQLVESECESYAKQSSLVRCQLHLFLNEIVPNDISMALSNGTILSVLIVFYTRDTDFDLSDVCLQENVGFEESVENLNLVKEFCEKYLADSKPFCFNFEDFLYSPVSMKINKLAFIAELFFHFELEPNRKIVAENHFELFRDYIKNYTKRHFHATTPFLSARIGDVTRNSFIKKGPYASVNQNEPDPTETTDTANFEKRNLFSIKTGPNNNENHVTKMNIQQATNNENNFIRKINTSSTNPNNISFNSLLDHVSLEASVNMDEANVDNSVHPMFSSRTYVKSSIQNRMNPSVVNTSVVSNDNGNHLSTAGGGEGTTDGLDLKTHRVAASTSVITVTNQTPSATSFYVPLNSTEATSAESSNINKIQVLGANTQTEKNEVANATATIGEGDSNGSGSGLVRRLSVTARPGDIFYKVKDVTESCSTTDGGVGFENGDDMMSVGLPSTNMNNPAFESESELKNESQKSLKSQSSELSPNSNSSAPEAATPTNRKTTTWNVKRTQTNPNVDSNQTPSEASSTSSLLGRTQSINKNSGGDSSDHVENGLSHIEPGSPMFAKELLSIRMQLKEKKSTIEKDKRKLESELERQRQTIGKQVFLQVVQKKHQQSANTEPPISPVNNALNPNTHPITSNNNLFAADPKSPREPGRRQWDKTNKNNSLIEIDQNTEGSNIQPVQTTTTNSTSSMSSTPTSSASQSPPSSSKTAPPTTELTQMAVDLSKAYYSRDEVMRAIESLKDRYLKESASPSVSALEAAMASKTTPNSSRLASSAIVRDIECLNNKLAELQAEISRLTLLQQKGVVSKSGNITNRTSTGFSTETKEIIAPVEKSESNTHMDGVNQQPDGSFFISFGSGTAKREKPLALTPKKNLIFIKTNDEKSTETAPKPGAQTNSPKPTTNLLMTATKPHSPQFDSYNQQSLINGGIDGDIEAGASSDGDSAELKQRKKAIILAKQLERRQQQEAIRQKREEERARKAEELRQKEEEAAMKKLLEKTRKETIFQAYIDKKKQLQEESLTNYFGHPNSSLLSAKSKFHSTQRLKPAANKQQQQQQHFAFDLKQNLMDQFDQASVISDRSTSTQQQMKTYNSSSNLFQQQPGAGGSVRKQASTRVSRPPSCARPTISSLRKMNRTFSLNNVSEIHPNSSTPTHHNNHLQMPTIAALAMTQAGSSASSVSTPTTQPGSSQPRVILPLTQASLALQNAGSKYASSNFLNESVVSSKLQPQQTRTTPRRRQPRNAQEFLMAAGIDSEQFLRKGYYVGSMMNLSDVGGKSLASETAAQSQAVNHHQQPQSSSSSSSMNGGGSLKRRNSIHETSGDQPGKTYYRQPAPYSKMRSMTTAIVSNQEESQSSAPVSSDSSSSPTPSAQKQQQKPGLAPLMSACSAISPRSNHDFDDYEYLERNFNTLAATKKDINTTTTTNTNVTDYYTDESNSCHNEDFMGVKNGAGGQHQFILSEQKFRAYANTLNGLVSDGINGTSGSSVGGGGGGKHAPLGPSAGVGATNWDHTSLASTNSLFSADENPVNGGGSNINTHVSNNTNTTNKRLDDNNKSNTNKYDDISSPHQSQPTINATNSNMDGFRHKLNNRLMNTSYIISSTPTSIQSSSPNNSPCSPAATLQCTPPTPTKTSASWIKRAALNKSVMGGAAMVPFYETSDSYEHHDGFHPPFRPSNTVETKFLPKASNTINENLTGESQTESENEWKQSVAVRNLFAASTTATITRPRRTVRPPNQLPLIPSSMSLHSFKNLPAATNTITKTNRLARTPNATTNKYLDLSSPMNFTNPSSSTNEFAEYNGPKLYKRLTGKTNKSTIINSLNQLVLAGTVNDKIRKQVVEEIEASDARHFVILFRDYHLQYRGVYSYTSETDYIEKIVGQGPQKISEDMIEKYYKYNSGGKQFSPVPTKHFSVQCDAVTIHSVYWQARKPSNPIMSQLGIPSSGSNAGSNGFIQSPIASNHNTLRR